MTIKIFASSYKKVKLKKNVFNFVITMPSYTGLDCMLLSCHVRVSE